MTGQPVYTIALEMSPSPDNIRVVQGGLAAYNRLYAPDDNYQPLTLFLRAADHSVAGGLLGETYWGWLHVTDIWIHETLRGQGYGTQLLVKAEQEALRRGCHAVHLDTLSFQALSFYERQGYTVFGVLPDHPMGHTRYFLKKALFASKPEEPAHSP
jgi:GNAT superfamily N-acetyltransferase